MLESPNKGEYFILQTLFSNLSQDVVEYLNQFFFQNVHVQDFFKFPFEKLQFSEADKKKRKSEETAHETTERNGLAKGGAKEKPIEKEQPKEKEREKKKEPSRSKVRVLIN